MDTIGITKMEATDTGLGAMQVIHLNLARKYSLQWYYNIIEALVISKFSNERTIANNRRCYPRNISNVFARLRQTCHFQE
jgi:hypothetical protein